MSEYPLDNYEIGSRALRGVSGVYAILNKENGKVYVGSSHDIGRRFRSHIHRLRKKNHHAHGLQNSVNKHGLSRFCFYLVEETTPEIMLIREQHYIDSCKASSRHSGYNSSPTAGNTLGSTWPEEAKSKASKRMTARMSTDEAREAVSSRSSQLWKTDRDRLIAALTAPAAKEKASRKRTEWWASKDLEARRAALARSHEKSRKPAEWIGPDGATFSGAAIDLSRSVFKSDMPASALSKVRRGICESYKGWKIKE